VAIGQAVGGQDFPFTILNYGKNHPRILSENFLNVEIIRS